MKKIIILIFSSVQILVFAQQFHSLEGIEDSGGNTHLLYRLGSQYLYYNPIYKMNVKTGWEQMLMDAYSIAYPYPTGEIAKAVLDFEFFPNDTNSFVNCGYMIYPDNHGYIARNDSIILGGFENVEIVGISSQNPLKTFASNFSQTFRSFDGGFTYPLDSIIQFPLLSVAQFDDNVFFGIDSEKRLIKSFNSGSTSIIADNSQIFYDRYFDFRYDQDQSHIYKVYNSWNEYYFSVSNNKGNPYTWTVNYQSGHPIFIANYSGNSGVVHLANWKTIYRSTNYGYNIEPYRNLDERIVGICEPANNIIYAATKYKIYEITQDSISIIKLLPFPKDVFNWFPLAVGNKWFYSSYTREYNPGFPAGRKFIGTKIMEVLKDTLISGKSYFLLINNLLNKMIFDEKMYLRVDSTSGKIYKYWPELSGEFVSHDLNAEVGDTIMYPLIPDHPFYILQYEQPISFLDSNTFLREYWENLPCGCQHQLIKGFGLAYTVFDEFGGFEDKLKGCILNGTVIGDTAIVVGIKDDQNLSIIEFNLSQNYPNPFNPSTRICWQSPVGGRQVLKVFDVLGNEVSTLIDEYKPTGSYEVEFQSTVGSKQLASGVYYYQLKAGYFVQTKKMILIK